MLIRNIQRPLWFILRLAFCVHQLIKPIVAVILSRLIISAVVRVAFHIPDFIKTVTHILQEPFRSRCCLYRIKPAAVFIISVTCGNSVAILDETSLPKLIIANPRNILCYKSVPLSCNACHLSACVVSVAYGFAVRVGDVVKPSKIVRSVAHRTCVTSVVVFRACVICIVAVPRMMMHELSVPVQFIIPPPRSFCKPETEPRINPAVPEIVAFVIKDFRVIPDCPRFFDHFA